MGKFFLAVIVATSSIFAQATSNIVQQVPAEVQQVINEELSEHGKLNTTGAFNEFKGILGFDKSTKFSDLKPGTPFPTYWLLMDSIIKLGENTPVSKQISMSKGHFIGEWEYPLFVNGKLEACYSITKLDSLMDTTYKTKKMMKYGKWHPGTFGKGVATEWEKVIKKWPLSEGYHPILIETSPKQYRFFYIPEKGDYNLTLLLRHPHSLTEDSIYFFKHYKNDPLVRATDSTYSTLSDSRIILQYLKTHPILNDLGESRGIK